MGTEQSTANHSYSHNQLPPGGYTKPYSLSPNNYHSAGSTSDLRHAYSYGNLPSNIRSGMSQGLPSRPVKTEKTIFIVADNGKRVQVTFQISEEDNLTCGWLVSETIRQFADRKLQEPYPNRPIIALQTVDDIITMDYWLSDLERTVSPLKDGMVLKPFYGSTEYIVTNQKVNLQFFYLLKVIGTGGFSKVYLARRKDNGQFYAIKVISKKEMLKKDKEENVFNERNIMTRLHHPFLVKLSYAFQTPEKLFLVMDFCPGGELFYHLSQRRKLREDEAKVYMGEIILALNYLHKNNIIYRDLKPENILLDIDGHLHLADFGLCKVTKSKQDLNYTFCGSPEYMAPEIIKRSGYNFSADFYTLGTLIYEMVVGRPPFIANRNKELYEKILHQEVTYPSHISPNLKMFLSQLLARNPKDRLGSKYGLSEIVNHPWCRDLDFVKIASKKMAAPIVPDISKTNFAREFIDARVSCLEDNLAASLVDAPPSRVPSMYGEGASEMENPAMYRKFANFSFYSNIDDPYEKFQDSIFGSNENTPDTSPKITRSASKFDNVLTPDILNNAIEKSTTEADNEKKKPLPLPTLQGKNSKEDYTDDINEKSPHINNLSEYNKAQTKFIKTSERSMTPRFPGQGLNIEPKKRSEDRKSSLPIFSKQEPKSKKPPLSYYGMNQNIIQTAPDQLSQKNKIFLNNSAQSRVPELDLAPKNFDDVSEEIMSRNDKPFTHIDSSRTVYRESQLAHLAGLKSLDSRRTGPRLSGLNNKTYSFMNFEEGAEDPTSDPKSATSNMIPAERFKKPMARALDSERVAPK